MAELAASATATLDDRLTQAEALVRSYCGWHIAPSRTETITVDVAGSPVLVLPTLHLTDVQNATLNDEPWAADVDYQWSPAGVLTGLLRVWRGRATMTITHGYTVPPPEVTAVVQALALRANSNPTGNLTRKQVGPFVEQYGSSTSALSLLPDEEHALGHYRLPPRP